MKRKMMNTYFSPDYISLSNSLETVRKSEWLAKKILGNGGFLVEPKPINREELAEFLDHDYVASLFDLTLDWSALGSRWNSDLLKSIRHSNGGVRDAVLSAIENGYAGSLSSGLHHAGRNYGMGFCQVNGLAMGAIIAKQHGKRVGVLDVDAHFGGGTYDIIGDLNIPIADLSTSQLDSWRSTSNIHHVDFYTVRDRQSYLSKVQKALDHLKACDVDFIMHNAGMDPSLNGISKETLEMREEMVANWCKDNNIKACWVLAGGYLSDTITPAVLTDMHYATYNSFNKISQ
jgi:acetoin utilization deacetylase AcuC-like enzyme